ncbi:MAG: flagellar FliJ family protein [Alphaproteobacteria bacterium]|nr:flagellar FliJ family protein [Alphaproteobacteria bacterium]
MADLEPLIRVRKHTVEQKQKFLADLYRQAEDLEREKKTVLERLELEREKVKDMQVEMLSYFGPYSEAVKERVQDIDHTRANLETRIEIAREDMREAFAELKKIEITQERREAEEEKELNKKESDDLDEIGLEIFRRQQAED